MADTTDYKNQLDREVATVTTQTLDLLFSKPEYQDASLLYFFYVKTAKWQGNSTIFANGSYCQKCLHWGKDRYYAARTTLKALDLIEDVVRKNKEGQFTGHYTLVKFIWKTTIPETTTVDEKTTIPENQTLAASPQIPDVTQDIPDETPSTPPLSPAHAEKKEWTGLLADDLDMFDAPTSAEEKVSVAKSSPVTEIPVGPAPDYYDQPQEAHYSKIAKADGLLSMTRGQELWLVEKTHVDLETIREECQKAYDWSVGKDPKSDYLMFIKNWLIRAKKYNKLTTLVDNGKKALPAGEWNNGDGTYTIVRGAGPARMEFTVTKKEYFKMIDAQEAAERKALNQAESEVNEKL